MLQSGWSLFCGYLQDVCVVLTLILNGYMIFLILTKSPERIGNYKYLMLYISVFEILYGLLATLTKPFVHSYASRVIVIVDARNSIFSRQMIKVLNSCICGFYGCSVSILAIHFLYRYGSLDKARRTTFEGHRFFLWCLVPIVYGIVWGLVCYFIFPDSDGFTEFIRKDVWDYFELKIEDIVYTGPYYYPEDKQGIHEFEPSAVFGMAILWFIVGSSSFVVIYYGINCWLKMRKLLSHSTSTLAKGLQQQLFKALVCQTIIPLIMLYIPCSIVFFCPLFQIDIGNCSAFITVSVAVYPAIDPLPTIFMNISLILGMDRIKQGFTIFGMCMNLLLIQLVLYRSPKNLGAYKYVMVYISVFEVFFSVVELMILPIMYCQDSAFFVIADPHKAVLSGSFLSIVDLIFCGSFAVSLSIFGVQFLYRYLVLTGNVSWTSSSPLNVFLWIGSPIAFASIWIFSCAIFLRRNEFVDKVLRETVLPALNVVDIETIGFVGVLFYPKLDDGTEVNNWDSFIGMCLCTTVLLSSEIVMAFFGVKCYLSTKSLMISSVGSTKFRRLQWQLFYALVSQTTIPIIFMQLPISMIYISTFLNCSAPFFGKLQEVTFAFYLATDALPTIFIIKSYRETVMDYLRCVKTSVTFVLSKGKRRDGSDLGTSMSVIFRG
ncbi:unnamed protein product [Caenorhabditis sp. 36 PRJEB53466]|nr:unnamed protein product [Caenorhabditis sp. 36 PRJEB53466]